ncbi:AfsR/SARP family transcriptional regulator [Dactylosporangium matsuzakiense]|uniref:AfsR/SARP family transcriptional regulator n=1 Tax=Dactylosporangium matsuzakiense TaxID=53360 RepID=UPI0021C40015|nr:BTAD domain-containing putative transcriptional regulator [Dactylosporangium matsuzakiense]UWZ48169.1 tetratricopeptide repeat protein [Dactylosporangium matsuzakiense]
MVRVRLLGPVDVTVGDEVRALPGRRRKAMLAVLGLHRGAVVGVDRLVGLVWDDEDSVVLANTVQQHVSGLRTVLGDRLAIEARPPGYLLHTETDLALVDEHVRAGRAADRPEVAAGHFRAALELWRGPALADLTALSWLRGQGERLDQLRRDIRLDLVDARLRLGEHDRLVPDLEALAAEHPFDERIHGQLMAALEAAGRPSDALAVYDRLQGALDRELGLRPRVELRSRRAALLAEQQAPARPPAGQTARTPVPAAKRAPAQLPVTVRGFAGRAAELESLDQLVNADVAPGGGGVTRGGVTREGPATAGGEARAGRVAVISGTAGVGKTALTLHWAHRAAPEFPDGQLYVNLRGFDPGGAAVGAGPALAVLLEALGVPAGAVPANEAERVELYRSITAGRRLLVVLDNARDAGQVRPLLPGPGPALALVTSRERLVLTSEQHSIGLDLMTADEAHDLLRRRLGESRLAAEPGAAEDLVARCAHLPLAMGVVAAQAMARPLVSLAELAGELRDAARRWEVLDGGDAVSDVRAVLSWSYRALPPPAARMFRLLGAHPGPALDTAAAASLAGVAPGPAAELLADLCRASLLTEPEPGRFTHHDLLRGYCRELAAHEGADGAERRILDHYLHTALAAAIAITPSWQPVTPPPPAPAVTPADVAKPADAQAWLIAELPALLAAIDTAAAAGLDGHAWMLAWALTDLVERQGRWDEWQAAHTAGLRAAERLRDGPAIAHLHRGLGRLRMWQEQYADSLWYFEQARERFVALGDRHGESRTEHNLCQLADRRGRTAEAAGHAERSLALCRSIGDVPGVAKELNALAWCLVELRDFERARDACEEAAAIYREFDDPAQEGPVLHTLGEVHRELGDLPAAVPHYERAIGMAGRAGDRYAEAVGLDSLGAARLALGDPQAARAAWERSLTLFEELGHQRAATVRAHLTGIADADGDLGRAG